MKNAYFDYTNTIQILPLWLLLSDQTYAQTLHNNLSGYSSNTIAIHYRVDHIDFSLINPQMITRLFVPLVGFSSIPDPKGVTTYYEYDTFQRLMNIKDKDGNIIKHIDYHYLGQ